MPQGQNTNEDPRSFIPTEKRLALSHMYGGGKYTGEES